MPRAPQRLARAPAQQLNAELCAWSRGSLAAVGAAACGVAGVTGWRGFAAYAAVHLFAGAVLLLRMRCRPARFFTGLAEGVGDSFALLPAASFVVSGLAENVVMVVLVWTLAYAVVHFF